MKANGREKEFVPRKGNDEKYVKFLQLLAIYKNISRAAKEAEITLSLVYRRREVDPEFAANWDRARVLDAEALEFKLYQHAMYGVEKPVYFQGLQVATATEYDHKLGVELLRGLMPEKYGAKLKLESDDLHDLVKLMTEANKRVLEEREAAKLDKPPDCDVIDLDKVTNIRGIPVYHGEAEDFDLEDDNVDYDNLYLEEADASADD